VGPDAGEPVAWTTAEAPVPYPDAVATMEARVAGILSGSEPEQAWLVEHPALYTAGTSARDDDLLAADRFPVFRSGRGGNTRIMGLASAWLT